MPTPRTELIRQLAQQKHNEDNRHLPCVSAEDSELKESGYWYEARNELMTDTARKEHVTHVEQEALELGYRLIPKAQFAGGENPKDLKEKPQTLECDISEAMHTGIYISGTSNVGKSDLAMHISDLMMPKGITVLVVDTSQDWLNRSNIPNAAQVEAMTDFNLDKSAIFDTSQLTVLAQRKFIEKLCAAIWRHQTTVSRRKPIFLWLEEGHTAFPLGAFRSKKYGEAVRLVSVGRNIEVRIGVITQFASMVSKDVIKYMRQRYFGNTSEPNDVDYIDGFIGREKAKQLRNLDNGEFLYSFNGVKKLIQIHPHSQNVKPKVFQPIRKTVPSQPQAKPRQTGDKSIISLIIAIMWFIAILLALSQMIR